MRIKVKINETQLAVRNFVFFHKFFLHFFYRPVAVCTLPVLVGKCLDTQDYHKRWYYDDSRGNCVSFIYSGCAGNQNNFRSFESCTEYCGNRKSSTIFFSSLNQIQWLFALFIKFSVWNILHLTHSHLNSN